MRGLSAHMAVGLVPISLVNKGQAALVRNHQLVDWVLTRCSRGLGKCGPQCEVLKNIFEK